MNMLTSKFFLIILNDHRDIFILQVYDINLKGNSRDKSL